MFLKDNDFPYITALEIENVKCFKEKQVLRFADAENRPYQWTVLLGDNGTGKTTVLRSISINILEEDEFLQKLNFSKNSKVCKYFNLRKEKLNIQWEMVQERLNYNIFTQDVNNQYKVINTKKINIGIRLVTIGLELIAYGANRTGDKNTAKANPNDISSLIDDDAKLIDVERYFLDIDYLQKSAKTEKSEQEFETIKEILLNVLPDVTDIRITIVGRNHEVEFETVYGWVRYQDMSLGYQTITAWVLDLAIRMFEKYPDHKKPLEQPAVVLVDEIDLHMHPQWQQKIISYLSERFPKTQFIVTAHSPLIVQSATDANVIVLKRKGTQVIAENNPLDVTTWRIDQILASDLFGISSRNLDVQKKIERRKHLTLKDKLTAKEKQELQALDAEVEILPTAENPEMIRAMELIQEAAKQLKK